MPAQISIPAELLPADHPLFAMIAQALAVVAETAVAFELARAALEKLGGDALADVLAAHTAYLARIGDRWQPR